MVQRGYLLSELRRRWGRTLVTALGLAVGVGLVIGIVGVSQGLEDAQQKVLSPLEAIGGDILVTRVAGSTNGTAASSPSTAQSGAQPGGQGSGPAQGGTGQAGTQGTGNGGARGFFGGPGGDQINQADTQALLQENNNVITDLSKLGKPGETFTHDFFLSSTLLSFPDQALAEVSKVPGVTSAVGGLTQTVQHQTGTVPQIVAQIQTGGDTVTQTVRPDPLTDAEQKAVQECLASKGVTITPPSQGSQGAQGGDQAGPRDGGGARGPGGAFEACMPERFREFRATFTNPLRTIQQVVNPPSTDINTTSYTAAGIDPAHPDEGLVTKAQLTAGSWIATADQVLVNEAYANKDASKPLTVGSELTINAKTYKVVGLVKPTLTGSIADVYFPLATLQELSGKQSRVSQILVKVDDASKVDAVAAAITKALPGAEVVTTKALADKVTGSLADAKKLTDRLGGVLGVIVLASAFVIAVLLTLSSIGKRVREIGTLRAIGWSRRRVVSQILAETVGIGVVGAVLGIGIGYLASAAVSTFSPTLTATAQGVAGFGGSSLSRFFGQATEVATTSSTVHLTAPIHLSTLGAGMALAILGGLLAGGIGALRAARLAPAEALRNLA